MKIVIEIARTHSPAVPRTCWPFLRIFSKIGIGLPFASFNCFSQSFLLDTRRIFNDFPPNHNSENCLSAKTAMSPRTSDKAWPVGNFQCWLVATPGIGDGKQLEKVGKIGKVKNSRRDLALIRFEDRDACQFSNEHQQRFFSWKLIERLCKMRYLGDNREAMVQMGDPKAGK